MLNASEEKKQVEFFTPVFMDKLIPDDYILKKVDKVIKTNWVYDEVRHLYSENMGRPSIDPVRAVRLMLAGFFHGIVHDRKLMREANLHLGIRWFAGYGLYDKLPDHSSLSKLRKRWGVELFEKIFRRTVRDCIEAGLVDSETVHVDATLIRADVSWDSVVEKYIGDVIRENGEGEDDDPGRPDGKRHTEKVCKSDPDASLTKSSSHDRPQPRYKSHLVVEDRSGVVLDVAVTTGRTAEASMLEGQMERVAGAVGEMPKAVTADSSYSTGRNYEKMESMGVEAVIPLRKVAKGSKYFPVDKFEYDESKDIMVCPAGKVLEKRGYNEKGPVYKASASKCRSCTLRRKCFAGYQTSRIVRLPYGHGALKRAREARDEDRREKLKRHKWMVEGRNGEAKTVHGMSRAVRRGLEQVMIQVLLTMAVMNLKRLAGALLAAFEGTILLLTAFTIHLPAQRPVFHFHHAYPGPT